MINTGRGGGRCLETRGRHFYKHSVAASLLVHALHETRCLLCWRFQPLLDSLKSGGPPHLVFAGGSVSGGPQLRQRAQGSLQDIEAACYHVKDGKGHGLLRCVCVCVCVCVCFCVCQRETDRERIHACVRGLLNSRMHTTRVDVMHTDTQNTHARTSRPTRTHASTHAHTDTTCSAVTRRRRG